MRTWIQQKGLIPVLGFISVFLLVFALWFLWDGLIGYPRSNERWDTHERLKAKSGEWKKTCATRGWTTEPPHQRYDKGDLIVQFKCASKAGAIGISSFLLLCWLRAKKTTISG